MSTHILPVLLCLEGMMTEFDGCYFIVVSLIHNYGVCVLYFHTMLSLSLVLARILVVNHVMFFLCHSSSEEEW